MEDFDATEEVHSAIEKFIAEHGSYPQSIRISLSLKEWLEGITREQNQLSGATTAPGFYRSSDSSKVVKVVVDPDVGDYEVIAE